jgi:hypothetical protein
MFGGSPATIDQDTFTINVMAPTTGGNQGDNNNNQGDNNNNQGNADPAVTPLPAALPLFATGLGALGLLGWRRKRKAQAA